MNENTITITLDEYTELLKKAERIAAVERIMQRNMFPLIEDIKDILDIKVKES